MVRLRVLATLASLAAIVLGLSLWLLPSEAHCAFCPGVRCLSRSVCMDCVCMKGSGENMGRCVSFHRAEQLVGRGYGELP